VAALSSRPLIMGHSMLVVAKSSERSVLLVESILLGCLCCLQWCTFTVTGLHETT
jgi:hypothetical protein